MQRDIGQGQRLADNGIDLNRLAKYVAGLFDIDPGRLFAPGRYPEVVQARSLLCFWAVRSLGSTATGLAGKMGLTQPAVSISVKRGGNIAREKGFDLERLIIGK